MSPIPYIQTQAQSHTSLHIFCPKLLTLPALSYNLNRSLHCQSPPLKKGTSLVTVRNPDLGNETTAASTLYWHHSALCGHQASGWGVPPDHFGPGGSKPGACRALPSTRTSPGSGTRCLGRSREWKEMGMNTEDSECLPSLAVSTVARRPRQGSSRQMGPSPREQPSMAAPALLLPAGSGLGRAPGAAPLPRRCTQLLHGPISYPSLKHTSN